MENNLDVSMSSRFSALPSEEQHELAASFLSQTAINLFSVWFEKYMADRSLPIAADLAMYTTGQGYDSI